MTATETRQAWITEMSTLMRREEWRKIRESMASEKVHRMGRSREWRWALAWFDQADKEVAWDDAGDKFIAIQALIWFVRAA